MEDWNVRWLQNQADIIDIKNMENKPEEWNECYKRNILVDREYSYSNWLNMFIDLTYKQMELLEEKKQMAFSKKRGNEINEYMFITCNPDPKYNLSVRAMYDKLCKLCKSTRIIEYLFSIEQRGATLEEMGHGIHAHILIKHKFPNFCKLQGHFYNAFKTVIENIKHIDIKHCKNVIDVRHRISYIKGDKLKLEKQEKVEIDKIWRKQWNIEDYYGNINIG